MELTPDKWQRAKAVFDEALQKPASERASFLAAACQEADLREEVEQLLRNHEQAGSFLSKPAIKPPTSKRIAAGSIVAGRFKILRATGFKEKNIIFETIIRDPDEVLLQDIVWAKPRRRNACDWPGRKLKLILPVQLPRVVRRPRPRVRKPKAQESP
jgi:hypothetical protein